VSGELELLCADKDEVVSSGEIVVYGEALALGDEKGALNAPPAIVYANGSGAENASSQVSARPLLF
jgi:hypothetical protein